MTNQLSDLELVAQAMAITDAQPQPSSNRPGAPTSTSAPAQPNPTHAPSTNADPAAPEQTNGTSSDISLLSQIPGLEDLDLSSLSAAELDSLQPILAALTMSVPDEEGDDGEGNMVEILRQLDAAGDVADDLEGKLDKLLERLGGVEEEIVQDTTAAGEEGQSGPRIINGEDERETRGDGN